MPPQEEASDRKDRDPDPDETAESMRRATQLLRRLWAKWNRDKELLAESVEPIKDVERGDR